MKKLGFSACLLSNNKEPRVKMFNEEIQVNYIFKANKPSVKNYQKAMELMGTNLENTLFVGASYSIPINRSWLDCINVNVDAKGIGDIYWDEANSVKQPFYGLLGASVRFQKSDFSLDIWGDNLTNTQYNTFYFVSIGNAFLQQGNPARCGVTLRMNFKTK